METHEGTSGPHTGPLGLSSVLVGSLPATLMTGDEPDRYTVEAVFTRRPEPDEVLGIQGDDTRERLARAGYPSVELTVSDRRLKIANTTLEELREGLAGVLADRLSEISAGVHAQHEAAALRFQEAAESEHDRAAAVAALAATVRFDAGRERSNRAPGQTGRTSTPADRVQIDEWTDEGGKERRASP